MSCDKAWSPSRRWARCLALHGEVEVFAQVGDRELGLVLDLAEQLERAEHVAVGELTGRSRHEPLGPLQLLGRQARHCVLIIGPAVQEQQHR